MNSKIMKASSGPAVQRGQHRHCIRALLGVGLAASLSIALAQSAAVRAELPTVKVGDRWKHESRDKLTGAKTSDSDRTVTAVTASQIESTTNAGKTVWTPELNVVESPSFSQSGDPKHLTFPLEVGKKWDFKFYRTFLSGAKVRFQMDATVVGYDKIKVPAGEFDAFKIEYSGYFNNETSRANGRIKATNWYAPAARGVVKTEFDDTYNRTTTELVELQLQP